MKKATPYPITTAWRRTIYDNCFITINEASPMPCRRWVNMLSVSVAVALPQVTTGADKGLPQGESGKQSLKP
jgi:hypothetical protein